jgi:WXG100 family type VII secretion target
MADHDGYRVDLNHLDQTTARVAGLQGFVEDSLAGLDARIAAMHQQWSGAAAARHAAAHKEWMTAATTVREGIAAMRQAAADAHTAYTEGVAAVHKTLGA